MSFINERCAIIRRSDKDMFYMYLGNDGLYYNYYDADGCIVHRGKLINDMVSSDKTSKKPSNEKEKSAPAKGTLKEATKKEQKTEATAEVKESK